MNMIPSFFDFSVKFAQDHAKKVQQFETQNRARLKQKQKALDQRFKEDLKNYQMFGKPPGSKFDFDVHKCTCVKINYLSNKYIGMKSATSNFCLNW